jgi:subtilisin family serine protease
VHAFSTRAATAESTTFQILKGIDWSVLQGARVINMSFAGPRDPALERALRAAHDRNLVLVAAAGNADPKSPPLFPGADPNVIAVTAVDIDNNLFPDANRRRYAAIAALGVDVVVPAPDEAYQLTTGLRSQPQPILLRAGKSSIHLETTTRWPLTCSGDGIRAATAVNFR